MVCDGWELRFSAAWLLRPYERPPLSCRSGKIDGRNDMRATGFVLVLLTTAVAAEIASAQSSYPCTETNANLPNPYRQVAGMGLSAAAVESGQCRRRRSER